MKGLLQMITQYFAICDFPGMLPDITWTACDFCKELHSPVDNYCMVKPTNPEITNRKTK
jgi:hypothetical protein